MTPEEKLEVIEEQKVRKMLAQRLGMSVENLDEYRLALTDLLSDDYDTFTAFKKYFEEHQTETGISPFRFRDDPTSAIIQYLFS
jgi:hypothetical protein